MLSLEGWNQPDSQVGAVTGRVVNQPVEAGRGVEVYSGDCWGREIGAEGLRSALRPQLISSPSLDLDSLLPLKLVPFFQGSSPGGGTSVVFLAKNYFVFYLPFLR